MVSQRGKSTCDAILSFINYIHSALNKKEHVVSLFIDLKKAFDTVNHKILISKLHQYGIRGFERYLLDRRQCVKIGQCTSHVEVVNIGVPQGAVIAPLLFLLYINDLVNVSDLFSHVLFADDTAIFSFNVNFADLVSDINDELQSMHSWMLANRLSLNLSKTYSLIFSNCDYNIILNPIVFGNQIVNVETNGKFLRLIMDNKLTFDKHVLFICNKLSKTVGILFKIRNCVPSDLMVQLYYSLAYPYIHYCNLIWANTYHVHLKPIITLQKKLIRIISNAEYLDHTEPLFSTN